MLSEVFVLVTMTKYDNSASIGHSGAVNSLHESFAERVESTQRPQSDDKDTTRPGERDQADVDTKMYASRHVPQRNWLPSLWFTTDV